MHISQNNFPTGDLKEKDKEGEENVMDSNDNHFRCDIGCCFGSSYMQSINNNLPQRIRVCTKNYKRKETM